MSDSSKTAMNSSDGVTTEEGGRGRTFSALAWTGLIFAFLQSICTVMVALGGARLLLSLLSLAAASSVFARMNAFHRVGLRIPMLLFACVGAILNLIVVAQVRRLRNRPSARWRLDVSSLATKLRQERWQIVLSVVTLVLVVVEEALHRKYDHIW